MSQTIFVSKLKEIVEPLTGFDVDDLVEIHIMQGRVSFFTKPHQVTGMPQLGVLYVVPDPNEDAPAPNEGEVAGDEEFVED